MPTTQRRIRRKQLKEPDEFQSFIESAGDFLTEHLSEAVWAAAIVVGVTLIAIGAYVYERHRDRAVSAQFYSALTELKDKQYKDAERDFIDLAANASNRELGRLSRLYLAKCYLADNDLPRARDSYAAFLSQGKDPEFRGIAMMDLGVVYERMGDLNKAKGIYRQAADQPGTIGLDAELAVARIEEAQSEKSLAIAAYQQFLQQHPFATQRQNVVEALARLGASPPAAPANPYAGGSVLESRPLKK